ncbi:MAG: rRNA maturation RNase YbeY [Saprospiraceae bacterium]
MIPDFPNLEETDKIEFFAEHIDFQIQEEAGIQQWISKVIEIEDFQLTKLSFIFCSDEYLHEINLKHLNHDTYTDIITFPYSEVKIEGDIFISIDRVKENAKQFKTSFEDEFCRVVIHGVLHLCGYRDKTPAEKALMRAKEEDCLALRKQSFIS